MELSDERFIAATVERTWMALNHLETLKACIKGCQSIEITGDDEYHVIMKVRIGPVNATFNGKLALTNIEAPTSCTIVFEGQGGAAGFAKGSAVVKLDSDYVHNLTKVDEATKPAYTGTHLRYTARAQIGGKIAQVGSRLMDSAASKMASEFFDAFEQKIASESGGTADQS